MRLTAFVGLFIGSCDSRPGEVIVLKISGDTSVVRDMCFGRFGAIGKAAGIFFAVGFGRQNFLPLSCNIGCKH